MPQKIIDIHCHHKIFTGDDGFISPKYANSIQMRTFLKQLGAINFLQWLGIKRQPDKEKLNAIFLDNLIDNLNKSNVDHAVVLALDGAYTAQGTFDKDSTAYYINNDAVIRLSRFNKKILTGASINPLRRDWKNELTKCIENKVALIKWLPNVMGFNPSNPVIEPFYQMLVENDIPLLSHVGFEYAVPAIDDDFASLDNLWLPLKMGVRVIAAHCCGGRPLVDSRTDFKKMISHLEKYPNLYIDVAGMATIHRRRRMCRSVAHHISSERLVFGTDYPIPTHPWAFLPEIGIKGYCAARKLNPFDRDIILKEAIKLPSSAFSLGYNIINQKTRVD